MWPVGHSQLTPALSPCMFAPSPLWAPTPLADLVKPTLSIPPRPKSELALELCLLCTVPFLNHPSLRTPTWHLCLVASMPIRFTVALLWGEQTKGMPNVVILHVLKRSAVQQRPSCPSPNGTTCTMPKLGFFQKRMGSGHHFTSFATRVGQKHVSYKKGNWHLQQRKRCTKPIWSVQSAQAQVAILTLPKATVYLQVGKWQQ